LATISLPEDEI